MLFSRFVCVLLGMSLMPSRSLAFVSFFFMLAGLVVSVRFFVVFSCFFMMFGSFFMVGVLHMENFDEAPN